MGTSWHRADDNDDMAAGVRLMLTTHHPRLAEAAVRVGICVGYNPDGDAITHGGYPAAATMKVVKLKDRVTKGYDAELSVDERVWRDLTDAQRLALLDHELSHIDTIDVPEKQLKELRAESADAVSWKTDDIGRPKLRSVPGDWMAGDGFTQVVARHGLDAIEYRNIAHAKASADQARQAGEDGRASEEAA
jgi:hypothetical protein